MLILIVSAIFNFAGALALLLWGMDLLSIGIQKGAGNKLQSLLSVVSGNRVTAVLTGLFVTGIIQSSSATTVMVVSFVNAQNRYTIDSYILQIEKEIALMSAKTMTMLDEIYTALKGFDLGFITNPKNGRVKGLKVVSLDRTYLGFNTNPKNG